MEQDWVAKHHQRGNARWMKYAIWLWALVGLVQAVAWYRVSQFPPSDIAIAVTLEDVVYSRPDGWQLVVDRQTWMTWEKLPDGTLKLNGKTVPPPR